LASVGLAPENFAFPPYRRQLSRLVARLVFQAEEYEESARYGTSALGNRAAWAVLAAARIYGGIGRKVRALEEAGLDSRVSTTKAEKARAVSLAFGEMLVRKQRWPMPGPNRDGLWTLPE